MAEQAVKISPNNIEALYTLANAKQNLGLSQETIIIYQKILKLYENGETVNPFPFFSDDNKIIQDVYSLLKEIK